MQLEGNRFSGKSNNRNTLSSLFVKIHEPSGALNDKIKGAIIEFHLKCFISSD